VRARHPYLKQYVGDWPVKEYLKWRFSNQQNYKYRIQCEEQAAQAKNKGKGKAVQVEDTWESIWDFGSTNSENSDNVV
jgi:hypothetical protein